MSPAAMVMIVIVGFPNWTNSITGKPVTKIQCAPEMKRPLLKALTCLKNQGAENTLKTYHGCYNKRKIAGTDRWSKHAYGRAIDVNVGLQADTRIVECFEQAGFTWGGRWFGNKYDPMHFELKGGK